jgi:hypothetical protein
MTDAGRLPASFRDPSGYLFRYEGALLRAVQPSYREHYERLMESGLYAELAGEGLLVEHEEDAQSANAPLPTGVADPPYKVLRPRLLPFVSYPYEWCFGQLKAAAETTLRIHQRALEHGMVLKDASAYNIQFAGTRPMLIDTLSFETWREGEPWIAYRQFCQHFLAPLALMARRDVRLNQLLRVHIDGIPLDLAARLLGWRSYLSPNLFIHIHLHARSQQRHAQRTEKPVSAKRPVRRIGMLGLADNLLTAVKRMAWSPRGTEWADYYTDTNYSDRAFAEKQRIVADMVAQVQPATAWDLGANTGVFSRIAAKAGAQTVAFDVDPAAVERGYRAGRDQVDESVLTLVMDLANPSPGLGWAHAERSSLAARGPADLVMALALVHHLCISHNVPLREAARFFANIARHLVIEFVPREDSQVNRLFVVREDIFPEYTREGFEGAFQEHFEILARTPIPESAREIYLMKRRAS